jgi:formate hydrogenlyase transcriptional activator
LRQRRSDIPLLTAFFVERFARQFGNQITGITQDTMDVLSRYDWPGNIRELQNVIERAVVLPQGPVLKLGADMLPISGTNSDRVSAIGCDSAEDIHELSTLEEVEKHHIHSVLEKTSWTIEGDRGAAKILALHPNTLRSRMKKLGIERSNTNAVSSPSNTRTREAIA